MMDLSVKQAAYIKNANSRWNIKCGASGAGKTFIDYTYVIPRRITERIGKDGLNVIMGATSQTIDRNVLEPMRKLYGNLIGNLNSQKNYCLMFGERVYCIGAEKINQIAKIQGATFKYLYGDEVAKWSEDVFNFVKSRLRTDCSCADLTLNPEHPNHFMKRFIDSDADIYYQHYTIDDNPFYPEKERIALKSEYKGTVLYDRLILGLWKQSDGLIYPSFANNNSKFIISDIAKYLLYSEQCVAKVLVGQDWGHSKSSNVTSVVLLTSGFEVIVADELHIKDELTPMELYVKIANFLKNITKIYGGGKGFGDNAEGMLVRGLRHTLIKEGVPVCFQPCVKHRITDRITFINTLFAQDRIKIAANCTNVINSFNSAVWDKSDNADVRLDDGSVDICPIDATEYALCEDMLTLEKAGHLL